MKTTTVTTIAMTSKLAALIPLPGVLRFRACLVWDGCQWRTETQAALQGSLAPLATQVWPASPVEAPAFAGPDTKRVSAEGITFRPAGVAGEWSEWTLRNKGGQKPTALRDLPALLAYHNVR